jgi:hypothetical protein
LRQTSIETLRFFRVFAVLVGSGFLSECFIESAKSGNHFRICSYTATLSIWIVCYRRLESCHQRTLLASSSSLNNTNQFPLRHCNHNTVPLSGSSDSCRGCCHGAIQSPFQQPDHPAPGTWLRACWFQHTSHPFSCPIFRRMVVLRGRSRMQLRESRN